MTYRKRKQSRHAQYNRKLTDCRKHLASERNINIVHQTQQRKRRRHQCVKCKKTFVFESNLLQQLKTHDGETVSRTIDLLNSTNESLSKRQCDPRGKSFTPNKINNSSSTTERSRDENTNLKNPKESTNVQLLYNTKESVQCEQCDKRFNLEPELKVNMEKTHNVITNRGDTDRGSDGKFKAVEESVYDTNNNDEQENFECEKCEKSLQHKSHLNNHKRAAHSADNILRCFHCGKHFINKDNYHNHVMGHVIKGLHAKPYVTSHGAAPEGAGALVDDIVMATPADSFNSYGFTMGDHHHDNALQPFSKSPIDSEFTYGSNPCSNLQHVPRAGKQSCAPHTMARVTLATNPSHSVQQSPAPPEVTIENQQQMEVETVIRVQESGLNR